MDAVALRNKFEDDLFPETVAEDLRKAATILEYPTYVLLTNITHEQYRGELSLPDVVEGNQVIEWKERIFIPDTDEPFRPAVRVPDSDDDGPDIDVPVRRKA
jgi:hypothetical protein